MAPSCRVFRRIAPRSLQQAGVFQSSLRPEVAIALFRGGIVGLFKSRRDGDLQLCDQDLYDARQACWRALVCPRNRRYLVKQQAIHD